MGSLFEEAWAVYPRKVSKQQGQKAYEKLNPDPELHRLIVDHIRKRATVDQQWKDKAKIPHFSTFINQRRFDDDLHEVSPVRLATVPDDKSEHYAIRYERDNPTDELPPMGEAERMRLKIAARRLHIEVEQVAAAAREAAAAEKAERAPVPWQDCQHEFRPAIYTGPACVHCGLLEDQLWLPMKTYTRTGQVETVWNRLF